MKNRHTERGATLPETVIVMGVVLALLVGIVDFGEAVYSYTFVTNAAREGARWAMVRGENSCAYSSNTLTSCNASQTTVQTYVKNLFTGPMNPANATVTASWPNCTVAANGAVNAPGCTIEVTVAYDFAVLPFLTHATIPLTSTSQMVISQ